MLEPWKPDPSESRRVMTFRAEPDLYEALVKQTHVERCTLSDLLRRYAIKGLEDAKRDGV